MTNTNELTARLKAAAEKAGIEQWVNNRGEVNTADYEVDGGVYIDHICNCEIVGTESPQAEFIAMANPANILALVEALENYKTAYEEEARDKAVQSSVIDDALCKLLPGCQYMDLPDGGNVTPLEQVARMVEDYSQRIVALQGLRAQLCANADRDIAALRQHIAELEASHVKLRDTMAAIHNTIRMDGVNTPLAVIMSTAKCAHEESAAIAAGIKLQIEGE